MSEDPQNQKEFMEKSSVGQNQFEVLKQLDVFKQELEKKAEATKQELEETILELEKLGSKTEAVELKNEAEKLLNEFKNVLREVMERIEQKEDLQKEARLRLMLKLAEDGALEQFKKSVNDNINFFSRDARLQGELKELKISLEMGDFNQGLMTDVLKRLIQNMENQKAQERQSHLEKISQYEEEVEEIKKKNKDIQDDYNEEIAGKTRIMKAADIEGQDSGEKDSDPGEDFEEEDDLDDDFDLAFDDVDLEKIESDDDGKNNEAKKGSKKEVEKEKKEKIQLEPTVENKEKEDSVKKDELADLRKQAAIAQVQLMQKSKKLFNFSGESIDKLQENANLALANYERELAKVKFEKAADFLNEQEAYYAEQVKEAREKIKNSFSKKAFDLWKKHPKTRLAIGAVLTTASFFGAGAFVAPLKMAMRGVGMGVATYSAMELILQKTRPKELNYKPEKITKQKLAKEEKVDELIAYIRAEKIVNGETLADNSVYVNLLKVKEQFLEEKLARMKEVPDEQEEKKEKSIEKKPEIKPMSEKEKKKLIKKKKEEITDHILKEEVEKIKTMMQAFSEDEQDRALELKEQLLEESNRFFMDLYNKYSGDTELLYEELKKPKLIKEFADSLEDEDQDGIRKKAFEKAENELSDILRDEKVKLKQERENIEKQEKEILEQENEILKKEQEERAEKMAEKLSGFLHNEDQKLKQISNERIMISAKTKKAMKFAAFGAGAIGVLSFGSDFIDHIKEYFSQGEDVISPRIEDAVGMDNMSVPEYDTEAQVSGVPETEVMESVPENKLEIKEYFTTVKAGEGVTQALDRQIMGNPALKSEYFAGMSDHEIKLEYKRIAEEMGYRYEYGPNGELIELRAQTVHPGAEVKFFKGPDGKLHAVLRGDNVTEHALRGRVISPGEIMENKNVENTELIGKDKIKNATEMMGGNGEPFYDQETGTMSLNENLHLKYDQTTGKINILDSGKRPDEGTLIRSYGLPSDWDDKLRVNEHGWRDLRYRNPYLYGDKTPSGTAVFRRADALKLLQDRAILQDAAHKLGDGIIDEQPQVTRAIKEKISSINSALNAHTQYVWDDLTVDVDQTLRGPLAGKVEAKQ